MNNKSKKKNVKFIIVLISAAVVFAACVAVLIFSLFTGKVKASDTVKLTSLTDEENINLYALGGLSCRAPENTLPAFELASKKGLSSVVFQIKLTKDGVWVLSSDKTVNRMTDGSGKIADKTYFDLAEFTIDNGANYKKYENLKILTLDNALDACLENGLSPVIEVSENDGKALKKLSESVTSHGFGGSCTVISEDAEILKAIQSDEINAVYFAEKLDDEQISVCLNNPFDGVAFTADRKHNDSAKIKKLISGGMQVFCFANAEKKDFEYYVKAGVRNFVSGAIINE